MKIESMEDEATLLKKLQYGDEQAFASIYGHYQSAIHERVLQIVHSVELAEDITQEVFIRIWHARKHLAEVNSFSSYLFITARNHALNVLKSAARSKAGIAEIVRHFDPSASLNDVLQNKEYIDFIRKELDKLPKRTRQVFLMCREQSMTYNEVAAELGITRDAVKSRMMHAIKLLGNAANSQLDLPLTIVLIILSQK